ncbi:MAG: hypothetical protein ACOYN3_05060 [Acidimicrobiia bacterium]
MASTSPDVMIAPQLSELEAQVLVRILGTPNGATGFRNSGAYISACSHQLQRNGMGTDAIGAVDQLVERLAFATAQSGSAVRALQFSRLECALVDEALRYAYSSTKNPSLFYAEYGMDRNRAWILRSALRAESTLERSLASAEQPFDAVVVDALRAVSHDVRVARGAQFRSTGSVSLAPELLALHDAINVVQQREAFSSFQANPDAFRRAFANDTARVLERSALR